MEIETLQQRILIADDQQDILDALRLMLKGHGYTTRGVTSSTDLQEALAKDEFDVLLMDLNYARNSTSGQEGLDLLAVLQKNENLPPVVVMTGWATVGLAVEAMQRGVADFVEKPWTNERLLEILQKQVTLGRERRESRRRAGQESQARAEMISQLQRQKQEIADARAIQQGLLPKEIPQLAGYEISSAWQSALDGGRRLLRHFAVWRRSAGVVHRGRRGKRTFRCAADVQPASRGARIGFSLVVARWLVRTAERSTMPEYDCRPVHHFFLRAA